MLLSIKRKGLLYIVLLLLLVLLIVLGYMLWRDKCKHSNIDTPYYKILSSCMYSNKILEGNDISCIAFLEKIYKQENLECFDIIILNSSYSLSYHTICEEEGFITRDESHIGGSDDTYPIYLDFVFKEGFLQKGELQSVGMSLIEGEALGDVITILYEKGIQIPGLYIREAELMLKNGYKIGTDIEISDEVFLRSVSLLSANIYDLSYSSGQFIIDLELTLFEQEYYVQFNVDKIILSPHLKGVEIIIEDESDLEMYKENVLGDVAVFSVFNGANRSLSDREISEYCMEVSKYLAGEFLCTYLKNLDVGTITEEDIDKYIKLQTSVEPGSAITLSKLLPIYFIELDDVE